MDINEILMHLGEEREEYFNAIAPPVIQSSNFVFPDVAAMRAALAAEATHHIYTRGNNPTIEILRNKIAALENTEDALITPSGSAAIAIALISQLKAGDHLICVKKPYSWTAKLINNILHRFGVSSDFVDGRDIRNIESAIKPNTRVIYLESPNSITFELQDLEACASVAVKYGITTIIDNSHCSPLFQRPSDFGIDIILHSATKYINGHSDVVAGVICSDRKRIATMFDMEWMTLGTAVSPHDAALMLRGLRTLHIRLQRSNDTAFQVAGYLHNHPKVAKLLFPLHPSFPQYDLAVRQMKGCGGLITIQLKAENKSQAERFVNQLKCFLIAVSWGGYESLVLPSVVFHDIPGKPDSPLHWSWVRLYVGLEDAAYLIADLEQAFEAM